MEECNLSKFLNYFWTDTACQSQNFELREFCELINNDTLSVLRW